MLGMNRAYARDNNSTNYFGFDLGYDKQNNNLVGGQQYSVAQYNGNITGMVWKSKGDGEKRKYDFGYDAANRLLKADFTEYTSGSFNQNAGINYTIKMGNGTDPLSAYDANGNILGMTQYGWKIGASPTNPIDQLAYSYEANSNRLKQVTDVYNDNTSKLGDFKYDAATKTATDYSYDVNGNLTEDKNKKITSIQYNHLNLPAEITIAPPAEQPNGIRNITYTYDAAGNKLKKEAYESNGGLGHWIATTTTYIGGIVYESRNTDTFTDPNIYTNKLQFIGHEEGRMRIVSLPQGGQGWASDYMLKDHLGNVRMVLTEEQKTDIYPAATFEDALVGNETPFYTIDQTKIVLKNAATGITDYANNNAILNNNPSCTGTLCTIDNSQKLYKLNSTENKTGLGITLKVMAGDKIDVLGKSYYFQNNSGGTNSAVPVLDILSGLLGSPLSGSATSAHGGVSASQINTTTNTAQINALLNEQTSQSNGNVQKPKAFINVIFFDEHFKASGFHLSMVGDNSQLKEDHYLDLQNLTAQKSGYVYIYVSNESPVNVFFDNLQVVHTRSPIFEETHYYPFGLTMSGISSKALSFGNPENKFKYNGYELNTTFDLNLYETFYRSHDPQIGRFWQIDPKIIEGEGPYNSMSNNPIANVDILGDTTVYYNMATGEVINTINNAGALTRVQIAGTLYADAAVQFKDADWGNQSTADDFVNSLNSTGMYLESVGDGNVIAFETGELRLSFDGVANASNPNQGDGKFNLKSVFDDGSTVTIASFDAIGGPHGNGSPENGSYKGHTLLNRTKTGWYNKGMNKDGVGFSMNLDPDFKTYRTELRIHPDGGDYVGTLGCIGLTGDASQLKQFESTMSNYLKAHKNIQVNINIVGNPNNNGKTKVKTSLRE